MLYGTGWGETTVALEAGELATTAAEVLPSANRIVSFGGVVMDPADILYVGVTPQAAGLFQLAIRVPANAQPGDNQVVLAVYGKSTPVGPIVPVAGSQGQGIVVISQIYGGGGNSGAPLTHDFVELFNRGNATVDITGWTIQHASASGSTWDSTLLSGTILPGQYFLVQEGTGQSNTGVPLPTPDVVGGVGLSASSAKIALVTDSDLLVGSQPSDGRIIDFVGYGSGVSLSEGSPTETLNNTTAVIRRDGGCTDTNDNGADFSKLAPMPRNQASALNQCD